MKIIEYIGGFIYAYCTDFVINITNIFGLSYYEINAIIFCIAWPLITILLVVLNTYLIIKKRKISNSSKLYFFFLLIVLFSSCEFLNSQKDSTSLLLKTGDIIFHQSMSRQSRAIELATGSKYTHMGLIYDKNGKLFVFEAVEPVKFTPLAQWISRGINNHYVVKRLENSDSLITENSLSKMNEITADFEGKHYDIYFAWSDSKIYCSELVWKIYKETLDIEIGELEKLKDFDLSHPEIKKIMLERYGDEIPFEEKVISPVSIFESDLLKTVLSN